MTEQASAGDFHVQEFIKRKMRRKHKELMKAHAAGEGEAIEKAEPDCASPLLFQEQAAQSDEGHKKKRESTKPKQLQQQQRSLGGSCVKQGQEIGDKAGRDASQKGKKKKKKQKADGSTGKQSYITCVRVNQHNVGDCQEADADYVYVQRPVKKKKKRKLPEEDEVCEVPASETRDESDSKPLKKKKKKTHRTPQEAEEDTGETGNQSLVSSLEQTRQRKSTEEGGDSGDAAVMSEDAADVPLKLSKPAKAADCSQKAPGQAKKAKSHSLVMKKKSSESAGVTAEPSAANGKDQKSSSTEVADSSDEECSDNGQAEDLDVLKLQLQEFIPHVKNISDYSIRKIAGRDLARFKKFKKQGIAVRFGRFTQKENDQIQRNVEEFLSLTGIDSAEKLLFSYKYPEEQRDIQRLKVKHHFCEMIAAGIPRPWRLIYYRARKIYDPNIHKGKYSNEEEKKLLRYQAKHGNDWKTISEMMSRSTLSLGRKYSIIKSAVNSGPWSNKEIRKLMRAVEEAIKKRMEEEEAEEEGNVPPSSETSSRDLLIEREKLYYNLPWTEIETQVGTRNWRQCKQKWHSILRARMNKGKEVIRGNEALQVKINLIKRLHEMQVEDINDVKWAEVSNAIGDFPSSYLQDKLYKLKISYVPLWRRKTFSEIVNYLYEKKLPEFEGQLLKNKERKLASANSAARQHRIFLLSDIFDYNEDSD